MCASLLWVRHNTPWGYIYMYLYNYIYIYMFTYIYVMIYIYIYNYIYNYVGPTVHILSCKDNIWAIIMTVRQNICITFVSVCLKSEYRCFSYLILKMYTCRRIYESTITGGIYLRWIEGHVETVVLCGYRTIEAPLWKRPHSEIRIFTNYMATVTILNFVSVKMIFCYFNRLE